MDEWSELVHSWLKMYERAPLDGLEAMRFQNRLTVGQWAFRVLNGLENIMARGTGKINAATAAAKQGYSSAFVDIAIQAADEPKMRKHYSEPDVVWADFDALLRSGYRVGWSYNAQNDSVIVSVTCRDETSVNAGMTYTSFAGDWYTALQVALYKHVVIAAGVWSKDGVATRPMFG